MSRSLLRSHILGFSLVILGLAAASAAMACPDSKGSARGTSQPECDPEFVLASNTSQDAAEPPTQATPSPLSRYKDTELHSLERPMTWLLIGPQFGAPSGPKGNVKLSSERLSRAPERKPAGVTDTARQGANAKRTKRVADERHVSRPHRMPSPEIL